jgi:hypothetical protein
MPQRRIRRHTRLSRLYLQSSAKQSYQRASCRSGTFVPRHARLVAATHRYRRLLGKAQCHRPQRIQRCLRAGQAMYRSVRVPRSLRLRARRIAKYRFLGRRTKPPLYRVVFVHATVREEYDQRGIGCWIVLDVLADPANYGWLVVAPRRHGRLLRRTLRWLIAKRGRSPIRTSGSCFVRSANDHACMTPSSSS